MRNCAHADPMPEAVRKRSQSSEAELDTLFATGRTDDNLVIRVYDPNTGPADDVQLVLSPAAPGRATSITHNIDIGDSIRGFFPVSYRPCNPPPMA